MRVVLKQTFDKRSHNRSGANAVYADVVGSVLDGVLHGHNNDGAFGCVIRSKLGIADKAGNGRGVYDGALSVGTEIFNGVLGHKENALYVDGKHFVPIGLFNLFGGNVGTGDARVVYEDVKLAEFFDDLCENVGAFAFYGSVEVPIFGFAAFGSYHFNGFHAVCVVDVGNGDFSALFCEKNGFRSAKSAAGAGDYCYFSFNSIHFNILRLIKFVYTEPTRPTIMQPAVMNAAPRME